MLVPSEDFEFCSNKFQSADTRYVFRVISDGAFGYIMTIVSIGCERFVCIKNVVVNIRSFSFV